MVAVVNLNTVLVAAAQAKEDVSMEVQHLALEIVAAVVEAVATANRLQVPKVVISHGELAQPTIDLLAEALPMVVVAVTADAPVVEADTKKDK
jgi:hypothetical protein